MAASSPQTEPAAGDRSATYAMAIAFGLLSVPWTFGFAQVAGLPLWPSFVASASVFAAGGGPRGFGRSLANNALGAGYAAATLLLVAAIGAGPLGMSLAVGVGMLLASLHALVPMLSFTPAVFLGYAALFGVHAGGFSLALTGVAGELVATVVAMAIGAGLGLLAERLAELPQAYNTRSS